MNTPTTAIVRPNTKRELLAHALANPPLNKLGDIDWQEFWKQHEDLKAKLGYDGSERSRTRISTMVAALRGRGLIPRGGSRKKQKPVQGFKLNPERLHAPEVAAARAQAEPISGEERQKLYRQILAHPKFGTMSVAKLVASLPDIAARLGATTPRSINRVQGAISYLLNHKPEYAHLRKQIPMRASRGAAPHQNGVVEAPPNDNCLLTGPKVRIEFGPELLPTILHTIALYLGGAKPKK